MSKTHSKQHTEFLKKEADERKVARDSISDVDQLARIARRGAKVPATTLKDVKALDANKLEGKGFCRESLRLVRNILKSAPAPVAEKLEAPKVEADEEKPARKSKK